MTDLLNKYKIEKIPVGHVKLNDKNPRFIKDGEFKKLVKSLKEFPQLFEARPLLCSDRTGELIVLGGNMRYRAALDLQWKEVPVIVMRGLTESQEKEIVIKDNGAFGEWDMQILAAEWAELPLDNWGVELPGNWMDDVEENFDADAAVDTIKEPVTKHGDVWLMGKHRLMCGDSQIREQLSMLMGGGKSSMIFTDPPYNVNYGVSMKDKLRHKTSKENNGRKILNDHFKDSAGFYNFLHGAISSIKPHVAGDVYICMASTELHTLQKAFTDCGGHFSTFIIWVKNTFTIGRSHYQHQYEPILYGWFEKTSHYWSGVRNLGDVIGKNTLQYDEDGAPLVRVEACGVEADMWEFPKPTISKEHPTMKPVGLCLRAIRNSSMIGDVVLDAFCGSGTTLIAAEHTDRIFYGMELDPKYCDVIVARWEKLTGRKAELKRN